MMKVAVVIVAVVAIVWALIAAMGCAAALPTAFQTANYETEQLYCVSFADARAQADTCRAASRARFCAEYPNSCPAGWMDGGVE